MHKRIVTEKVYHTGLIAGEISNAVSGDIYFQKPWQRTKKVVVP
jgi:hypothetical protein